MPFKSEAQRRWMHATHPEMARRWEAHTPKGRLPKRVKPSKQGAAMTLNESVLEAGEVLAAVIAAGDRMQAETQATQQKVAAAIPAIVEDLATGGFIEAHEKAAMASALRDPVSALKVMSNLVAEARRQIKSASAATAKVAAPVLGSPTNLVLGSRGTEGRDSYSAFEDALFGNR